MEENHHQKTSSREFIFSFPSTPSTQDQDSDFEFGCLTPDSPSCDPNKNSPADHLFFNGRLLPHSFPPPVLQQQPTCSMLLIDNMSRATSRASSVSSKDSLMSSRSNSTNSSRSSVSSGRTSSSDNSERRRLYRTSTSTSARVGSKNTPMASKVVMAQIYGSSQRWQHIVPVPTAALKREDSRRRNSGVLLMKEGATDKKKADKGKKGRSGIWRRFFLSFLVACKECHALESSTRDDMLQGN